MHEWIEVVNPVAAHGGAGEAAAGAAGAAAARAARPSLAGCTVGFIDNAKPNFALLVDELAQRLVDRHGAGRIVRHRKPNASIGADPQVLGSMGRECDVVIAGSGD